MANLVQTERNTKQKTNFFVCIPEVPPKLDEVKFQTERNTKQKTNFFVCIPEGEVLISKRKLPLSRRERDKFVLSPRERGSDFKKETAPLPEGEDG